MRTSKRIVLSLVCFLFTLIILSAGIILPYSKWDSELTYYKDAKLRNNLAGSLDYLVIGASQGLAAFNPQIIDQELECNSYNLSNSMMTIYGRYWLLEKELARNPVETVVIEVSQDTFIRQHDNEYSAGDEILLVRMDSLLDRFAFVVNNVHIEGLLNIYASLLRHGVSQWLRVLRGNTGSQVNYSAKGFLPESPVDITLRDEEIISLYNINQFDMSLSASNIEQFVSIINLCKSYGVRVVIAVVPIPDASLWKAEGRDAFYDWCIDFFDEYDCEFYDFNLLKSRYRILNDQTSFHDGTHMSSLGSDSFTSAFCEIMRFSEEGENVSQFFYNGYTDMKKDSPYMQPALLHHTTN